MSIHMLVSLAFLDGCDPFGSLFVVVIKYHPWQLFCSETCHPIFFIIVKTDWMPKPVVFFIRRNHSEHLSCTNLVKVKLFCNYLMFCQNTKV